MSDMSSTNGYMGTKYVQEFGPIFFDMSSTSGNMCAKSFEEFGPRFLACHVPNLACHGVSISCVSINSVSCHVIILRVSVSVPCRGHPALRARTYYAKTRYLTVVNGTPRLEHSHHLALDIWNTYFGELPMTPGAT